MFRLLAGKSAVTLVYLHSLSDSGVQVLHSVPQSLGPLIFQIESSLEGLSVETRDRVMDAYIKFSRMCI